MKLHPKQLQISEIRTILNGATPLNFQPPPRSQAYQWIQDTLRHHRYPRLKKPEKGTIRAWLIKVTGLSRSQITRLIGQYCRTRRIRDRRGKPANAFPRRYLPEDVRALAELDALHNTLSGPATRALCQRAWQVFGDPRFKRLAGISNGHLYNLRHSRAYQRQRCYQRKTRPAQVNIGQRRKPRPEGRPGFIRVDSVHQGDLDGIKGLYHINAVDEVTQMQVVVSTEKISERYLLPALRDLLDTFPVTILGFHSDNGSEYINGRVAALLRKLHIELTKSRPRQSNDNALVESKNGSVVRKHLGYSHIPGRFAQQVNDFALHVLTPYLNFHRPCLFAVETIDQRGKVKKHYPDQLIMTPYDKLKSLPQAKQYLKDGITFAQLDDIAFQCSDNEAARQVKEARNTLFQYIYNSPKSAA